LAKIKGGNAPGVPQGGGKTPQKKFGGTNLTPGGGKNSPKEKGAAQYGSTPYYPGGSAPKKTPAP